MYSGLSVQTTKTIQAGRDDVQKFDRLVKVQAPQHVGFRVTNTGQAYMRLTEGTKMEKNWSFPKMHLHLHVFDDIMDKGAMSNMSTKPSEKIHGPIRKIYSNQTNFKNVADQVSLFPCL
jgi:hypothetical protein